MTSHVGWTTPDLDSHLAFSNCLQTLLSSTIITKKRYRIKVTDSVVTLSNAVFWKTLFPWWPHQLWSSSLSVPLHLVHSKSTCRRRHPRSSQYTSLKIDFLVSSNEPPLDPIGNPSDFFLRYKHPISRIFATHFLRNDLQWKSLVNRPKIGATCLWKDARSNLTAIPNTGFRHEHFDSTNAVMNRETTRMTSLRSIMRTDLIQVHSNPS